MAADPRLVARLDAALAGRRAVERRRMFGGVAYMLNGNLCLGVHNDSLIVRVGEPGARALLRRLHVRPMDVTGKPMKGWALVGPDGVKRNADLVRYVEAALKFVGALPPK